MGNSQTAKTSSPSLTWVFQLSLSLDRNSTHTQRKCSDTDAEAVAEECSAADAVDETSRQGQGQGQIQSRKNVATRKFEAKCSGQSSVDSPFIMDSAHGIEL